MIWKVVDTPNLWPSFIVLVILIALAAYGWCRRSVPGALLFAIGSLLTALWVAGSVIESAAVDTAAKIWWARFQMVWQTPAITAMICFILEFTWPGRWLTRRNLALLSIAPILSLALILTNDLHHLMWIGFTYDGSVHALVGPAAWVLIVYGNGLGLMNIVVLVWLSYHSPQNRWPVALILIGQIGARVIYVLNLLTVISSSLPLDILFIGCLYLMYAIALFAFRLFDPTPLARNAVIAQMREGMFVLDPEGRVANLNPSAQAILDIPEKRILGRPIQELLPAAVALQTHLPVEDTGQVEIRLGPHDYLLTISKLRDWRGLAIGSLLLLYDVTEQKRSTAQRMEEQQIRATLQERERMARELHDTLVQATASVRMQAETASILLERGEYRKVSDFLGQIADSAQQMHLDLRQYIFDVRSRLTAAQSFFAVLRDELARFGQTWKIETELRVPAELEQRGLDTTLDSGLSGAQIMGVIQEALSNVRKHASAQHVRVSFAPESGCLSIMIEDDGCGFDPVQLSALVSNHFGMRSMRERAQALGGVFEIHTAPGRGTQVIVSVPLEKQYGNVETGRGKNHAGSTG